MTGEHASPLWSLVRLALPTCVRLTCRQESEVNIICALKLEIVGLISWGYACRSPGRSNIYEIDVRLVTDAYRPSFAGCVHFTG